MCFEGVPRPTEYEVLIDGGITAAPSLHAWLCAPDASPTCLSSPARAFWRLRVTDRATMGHRKQLPVMSPRFQRRWMTFRSLVSMACLFSLSMAESAVSPGPDHPELVTVTAPLCQPLIAMTRVSGVRMSTICGVYVQHPRHHHPSTATRAQPGSVSSRRCQLLAKARLHRPPC